MLLNITRRTQLLLTCFLPQYDLTFLFHFSLINNIFGVTIQCEEGKFITQSIPEVQKKNLQFIDSSSEMSAMCENATKRVRRSNSTMSEWSEGRSPSPNATMLCSQMPTEHGEHNEPDVLGNSDEETSVAIGSDRGDNRKMKVLAFQLKRSYIENPSTNNILDVRDGHYSCL